MCQLANNCGNLSFYYSCFSCVIVSRCSSLSVAHFCSSKKAKLTVTHNIYWSALKSPSLSAAAPFPKIISNLRFRSGRQGGENLLFLGFCHYYQGGVQLAKLGATSWAICSVFYWNRAELVACSVICMIYRSAFVRWPSAVSDVCAAIR